MQELSSWCLLTVYLLGTCLGCSPHNQFHYVPPPGTVQAQQAEVIKDTEDTCMDCARRAVLSTDEQLTHQGRFFFGLPCCTTTKASSARLTNATECGRKGGTAPYLSKPKDDERVVGGVPAVENEIPWQVGVMWQNETWLGCGAILLSCDPVIVVSAAHCFSLITRGLPVIRPQDVKLSFGAHIMGFGVVPPLDENEIRLDVEDIIIHPSFSLYTLHAGISARNNLKLSLWENDIAVIKVKNGTTLDCKKRTIWPACLPQKNIDYVGWNRTVLSGWGRVEEGGNVSTILRKARIPIVSDEKCRENILDMTELGNITIPIMNENVTIFQVNKKQLCAGDIDLGTSGCQGDSGGPLAANDADSLGWSAVGIASYGLGECGSDTYGVFTEIGQYLDWIGSNFDLLPPE